MAAGGVSARAGIVKAKARAVSSQLNPFHELLVKLGLVFIEDSFLPFHAVIVG
jgi:hypothetical protein